MALIDRLKDEEGFEPKPYKCTGGKWTIGYGRNLDQNPLSDDERAMIYGKDSGRDLFVSGITREEAHILLENDIANCRKQLQQRMPVYEDLDQGRQDALVNMVFQLGMAGVRKFKKMNAALVRGDFEAARDEALDSDWARYQTPARALRVANQLATGIEPV